MEDVSFKRLLTPTRYGGEAFFRGDYTLNLYRGCNHGCIYCDSRSVCYHMEDFDHVRVKRDCLAALESELRVKKHAGVVCMGAASDAYNAREASLRVTRGALELLRRYGFGVSLATKGALILRDADVLAEIAKTAYACAAFSITTADAELAAVSCLAAQVKEYAKHVGGYSVDLDEFVDVPTTPFDPATGEIVEPQ